MKLKTLAKALYYSDPKSFGYNPDLSVSVDEIWNKVIKLNLCEFDPTVKNIKLNFLYACPNYVNQMKLFFRDYVADYYGVY